MAPQFVKNFPGDLFFIVGVGGVRQHSRFAVVHGCVLGAHRFQFSVASKRDEWSLWMLGIGEPLRAGSFRSFKNHRRLGMLGTSGLAINSLARTAIALWSGESKDRSFFPPQRCMAMPKNQSGDHCSSLRCLDIHPAADDKCQKGVNHR